MNAKLHAGSAATGSVANSNGALLPSGSGNGTNGSNGNGLMGAGGGAAGLNGGLPPSALAGAAAAGQQSHVFGAAAAAAAAAGLAPSSWATIPGLVHPGMSLAAALHGASSVASGPHSHSHSHSQGGMPSLDAHGHGHGQQHAHGELLGSRESAPACNIKPAAATALATPSEMPLHLY